MTHPLRSFLLHGSSLILLGLAGLASAAPQHAVTLYDEPPKYPANFTHFEYTNPDAPKGGTFREAGFGGFDSLNPFISKGVAADGLTDRVLFASRERRTNARSAPLTSVGDLRVDA